ncbi:AbrB family transcriptional regulator [Defluviimonas sp. D31]|uniref:AbrB family transcriptional regulator n=1 Tax=Defluviimonas sp. D31 TaxID=3083253 RepID=UPI00296F515A|nr:AbrB family transcriptional regulator [Defluviimonas sp. D31]MDW4548799.1 AbrB family transcriptional regulator [Defluviimonas sp. D31]
MVQSGNTMPVRSARLRTLAAAFLGAGGFLLAGWPLPLLLGPMLGCLAAALLRAPLAGMGGFGTFLRSYLGVAIGSTVTPGLIGSLPAQGLSLALIPLYVATIGAIGYPYFRRVAGFDRPTAFYAAMPGGLQDMLVFGEEAGGEVRAMSLIHATRVLVIVTVAPFLLMAAWGTDLSRPPGLHLGDIPAAELFLMLIAGPAGWKLAERARLFGASILGPLIMTAGLSLAGLIQHRPPAEMIWAAQFFIGIAVGAKYSGITARELRVTVSAGIGFTALLALVSTGFIAVAASVSTAPLPDILLSFLPGGQAEMAVIAIVAEADVGFVVAHHLTRIFVVILVAPLVGRRGPRRRRD